MERLILKYRTAIDLSGNEALFAVSDINSQPIISITKPMKGRSSSSLAPWIISALQEKNINIEDINEWTVGSGPGSFTGMRLVAGLVEGLLFNNPNAKSRCVPTAIAIAAAANFKEQGEIAVVFDGRNNELLIFIVKKTANNDFSTARKEYVISKTDSMHDLLKDCQGFCCLNKDFSAVEKVLATDFMRKLKVVSQPDITALINNKSCLFDNDLTKLAYIRPAVYTSK